jgi:LPS export ABC transporter protein LptC
MKAVNRVNLTVLKCNIQNIKSLCFQAFNLTTFQPANLTTSQPFKFFTGLLLFFLLSLAGCKQENADPSKFKVYEGPLREVDTIQTLYSDSARVVWKMNAPKLLDMANGDRIFPKGVNLVFYKKDGTVSSTLRSNHGKILKEKNLYIVTGDVVVVDEEKKTTINTEELDWSPTSKKVTTDKFVTITTPEELLKGTGLEANQDFSYYRILHPTGTFPLKNP